MNPTLYTRNTSGEGLVFEPGPETGSPWNREAQHGGPPCALLAGALESATNTDGLRPAFFRAELFRAVPMAPLRLETEVLRRGRRIVSVEARLRSDQVVARGSALFVADPKLESPPLEQGELPDGQAARALPGPDADLQPMIPPDRARSFPPGFHTSVEVETLPSRLQAAWIRIPFDFLADRPLTPFQRAAATSDFCNALRARHTGHQAGFVNVDSTVHFLRVARGEWLGLELLDVVDVGATGFARCALFDEAGTFAWVVQNSLANPRPGLAPG